MYVLQTVKDKNRLVPRRGIVFKLGGLSPLILETVKKESFKECTKKEWMKDKDGMKHNPKAVLTLRFGRIT